MPPHAKFASAAAAGSFMRISEMNATAVMAQYRHKTWRDVFIEIPDAKAILRKMISSLNNMTEYSSAMSFALLR